MGTNAREFVDFWVENSVHATEQFGAVGAEQRAAELARRCLEMAASQGLSKSDIDKAVGGDLTAYLVEKLAAANQSEKDRRDRRDR